MRIAAVHRGCGPHGIAEAARVCGFDGYLLDLAVANGARLVRKRVDGVVWNDGRPQVKTPEGTQETYDLLAIAVGVNSAAMSLLRGMGPGYQPPHTTKAYICELGLGQQTIKEYLGSSMHVFLLNIPRLEFAALIPKGDYVTVCLLGEDYRCGARPVVSQFARGRQMPAARLEASRGFLPLFPAPQP